LIQELNWIADLHPLRPFNVFTVDSYQGEENDIILLSLVRSNKQNLIGFLENRNRLVVALSRARRGLYLFGNSTTLASAESDEDNVGRTPLWGPLVLHMTRQRRFNLDGGLPVTCSKHGKMTRLYEACHFDQVFAGGCDQPCGGVLPCGHPCQTQCHPADHTQIACKAACVRVLTCGHNCSRNCTAKCYCQACGLFDGQFHARDYSAKEANRIDDSWPLDTFWGESPTKSCATRTSKSKHASFAVATKTTIEYSDARTDRACGDQFRMQLAPQRQDSRPLIRHSETGVSPTKSGGPFLSTPEKLRSCPIRTGDKGPKAQIWFDKRRATLHASKLPLVTPQAWQDWNAKKADKELAEKRRLEEVSAPKPDLPRLVFKETYIPTTLNQNGERVLVPSGPRRRLVSRGDIGASSLDVALTNCSAVHSGENEGKWNKKGPHVGTDSLLSSTEVSQVAKKLPTASKALVEVTNGVSDLSMDETMPIASGENIKSSETNRKDVQLPQSMSNYLPIHDKVSTSKPPEHLIIHGFGDSFGSAYHRRGCGISNETHPGRRDVSVLGRCSPNEVGSFQGRGRRPFRGDDNDKGRSSPKGDVIRAVGSSRGHGSFGCGSRERTSTTGSPRAQGYAKGGRQYSEEATPPLTYDLLGLESDFPVAESETSPTGELLDMYGGYPLQSQARSYTTAWGIGLSIPEQTTPFSCAGPGPTPQSSINPKRTNENLIEFD
jgi:AAA domain